ncbi:MAG: RDD family protein [Acidobacteria bacterium]|nr:RDD family protein [Acidobacteriota bacterium]
MAAVVLRVSVSVGRPLDVETAIALLVPIFAGITAAYHIRGETGPSQATIGKRLMGLRVVTESGDPLTPRESIRRVVARLVVSMPFLGAGCLVALFSAREQAVHDLLAGTVVERTSPVRLR